MSSGVTVTVPRSVARGDRRRRGRIEAEVNSEILWFESDDVSLSASADAYATMLLIPALHLGLPLEVQGDLSRRLLVGTRAVAELARLWWGVAGPNGPGERETRGPQPVLVVPPDGHGPASGHYGMPAFRPPTVRNALCFTGGVDSFFSLLRGSRPVHDLVYVHGYDIPLADTWRMSAFEPWFRRVAAATGARSVLVRTNLGQHPIVMAASWERTHGGALAAVGHLLVEHVGRLLISSSYPYAMDRPWGTHWLLDPLWSSGRLEVEHVGAEHWRTDKLVAIAAEPLVQRHLRVCHENRSDRALNCSECEKCVRTQLTLAGCNRLAEFATFTEPGALRERVEALPALGNPDLIDIYGRLLDGRLEPPLDSAVRCLLERSRP